MFGAFGRVPYSASYTLVSQAGVNGEVGERLGLQKPTIPVKNCRDLDKTGMINNTYLPNVEVNPETYEVRADGELLTCEPADILPMAQRYFLF
jgi:urease subunit alpha